jgi:hypothetical protein
VHTRCGDSYPNIARSILCLEQTAQTTAPHALQKYLLPRVNHLREAPHSSQSVPSCSLGRLMDINSGFNMVQYGAAG